MLRNNEGDVAQPANLINQLQYQFVECAGFKVFVPCRLSHEIAQIVFARLKANAGEGFPDNQSIYVAQAQPGQISIYTIDGAPLSTRMLGERVEYQDNTYAISTFTLDKKIYWQAFVNEMNSYTLELLDPGLQQTSDGAKQYLARLREAYEKDYALHQALASQYNNKEATVANCFFAGPAVDYTTPQARASHIYTALVMLQSEEGLLQKIAPHYAAALNQYLDWDRVTTCKQKTATVGPSPSVTLTAAECEAKFGVPTLPPLFENVDTSDLHAEWPPIKQLSVNDIRQIENVRINNLDRPICLKYVILEDGQLIISREYSDFVHITPAQHDLYDPKNIYLYDESKTINGIECRWGRLPNNDLIYFDKTRSYPLYLKMILKHPELARGAPVVFAGDLYITNGKITPVNHPSGKYGIDNWTGHYLCGGALQKQIVEHVFRGNGFHPDEVFFRDRAYEELRGKTHRPPKIIHRQPPGHLRGGPLPPARLFPLANQKPVLRPVNLGLQGKGPNLANWNGKGPQVKWQNRVIDVTPYSSIRPAQQADFIKKVYKFSVYTINTGFRALSFYQYMNMSHHIFDGDPRSHQSLLKNIFCSFGAVCFESRLWLAASALPGGTLLAPTLLLAALAEASLSNCPNTPLQDNLNLLEVPDLSDEDMSWNLALYGNPWGANMPEPQGLGLQGGFHLFSTCMDKYGLLTVPRLINNAVNELSIALIKDLGSLYDSPVMVGMTGVLGLAGRYLESWLPKQAEAVTYETLAALMNLQAAHAYVNDLNPKREYKGDILTQTLGDASNPRHQLTPGAGGSDSGFLSQAIGDFELDLNLNKGISGYFDTNLPEFGKGRKVGAGEPDADLKRETNKSLPSALDGTGLRGPGIQRTPQPEFEYKGVSYNIYADNSVKGGAYGFCINISFAAGPQAVAIMAVVVACIATIDRIISRKKLKKIKKRNRRIERQGNKIETDFDEARRKYNRVIKYWEKYLKAETPEQKQIFYQKFQEALKDAIAYIGGKEKEFDAYLAGKKMDYSGKHHDHHKREADSHVLDYIQECKNALSNMTDILQLMSRCLDPANEGFNLFNLGFAGLQAIPAVETIHDKKHPDRAKKKNKRIKRQADKINNDYKEAQTLYKKVIDLWEQYSQAKTPEQKSAIWQKLQKAIKAAYDYISNIQKEFNGYLNGEELDYSGKHHDHHHREAEPQVKAFIKNCNAALQDMSNSLVLMCQCHAAGQGFDKLIFLSLAYETAIKGLVKQLYDNEIDLDEFKNRWLALSERDKEDFDKFKEELKSNPAVDQDAFTKLDEYETNLFDKDRLQFCMFLYLFTKINNGELKLPDVLDLMNQLGKEIKDKDQTRNIMFATAWLARKFDHIDIALNIYQDILQQYPDHEETFVQLFYFSPCEHRDSIIEQYKGNFQGNRRIQCLLSFIEAEKSADCEALSQCFDELKLLEDLNERDYFMGRCLSLIEQENKDRLQLAIRIAHPDVNQLAEISKWEALLQIKLQVLQEYQKESQDDKEDATATSPDKENVDNNNDASESESGNDAATETSLGQENVENQIEGEVGYVNTQDLSDLIGASEQQIRQIYELLKSRAGYLQNQDSFRTMKYLNYGHFAFDVANMILRKHQKNRLEQAAKQSDVDLVSIEQNLQSLDHLAKIGQQGFALAVDRVAQRVADKLPSDEDFIASIPGLTQEEKDLLLGIVLNNAPETWLDSVNSFLNKHHHLALKCKLIVAITDFAVHQLYLRYRKADTKNQLSFKEWYEEQKSQHRSIRYGDWLIHGLNRGASVYGATYLVSNLIQMLLASANPLSLAKSTLNALCSLPYFVDFSNWLLDTSEDIVPAKYKIILRSTLHHFIENDLQHLLASHDQTILTLFCDLLRRSQLTTAMGLAVFLARSASPLLNILFVFRALSALTQAVMRANDVANLERIQRIQSEISNRLTILVGKKDIKTCPALLAEIGQLYGELKHAALYYGSQHPESRLIYVDALYKQYQFGNQLDFLPYDQIAQDNFSVLPAIACYTLESEQGLRDIVADYILADPQRFCAELTRLNIKDKQTWINQIMLRLLSQLLNRPVLIIDSENGLDFPAQGIRRAADLLPGDPIFVLYDVDHHCFHGLMIRGELYFEQILSQKFSSPPVDLKALDEAQVKIEDALAETRVVADDVKTISLRLTDQQQKAVKEIDAGLQTLSRNGFTLFGGNSLSGGNNESPTFSLGLI